MNYQIGNSYPLGFGRAPFGDAINPTWLIFRVPSSGEVAFQNWCSRNATDGVSECWWPVEQLWRRNPITGRKSPVVRAMVPGYVFTRVCAAPRWDVLRDRLGRKCIGVVGAGEVPMTFTDEDLADMEAFAARVEAGNVEANRSESDRFPAQAGGTGRLLRGPMQGQAFPVVEVSASEVVMLIGAIRMKARRIDVRDGG